MSKGAAPAAAPAATASLGAAIVSFWQGQPHVLAAIVAGLVGAAALTLLQGSGSNRRRSARASQDEASLAGEERTQRPRPSGRAAQPWRLVSVGQTVTPFRVVHAL